MENSMKTSKLYILRPSFISEVSGRITTDKEKDVVIQRVKFQNLPQQITIVIKQNDNTFIDCENEKQKYYSETIIEENGLFSKQRKHQFAGIFPDDLIDLPTFMFLRNHPKLTRPDRLKYLISSSKKGYKKLKDEYYRQALKEKESYTKEELKCLRELFIEENDFFYARDKTKKYTTASVVRRKHFICGKFVPTRDFYAGTREERLR